MIDNLNFILQVTEIEEFNFRKIILVVMRKMNCKGGRGDVERLNSK